MNSVTPNPALVTQRAVERLPRMALLLFCAAYVLPGLFGRDPWRNADQAAFGYMLAMAEDRTSWWAPTIGGLPLESALLPHWLGAGSIALLSPLIDAPLAARVPFGILLALVLVLTWYATFQLARTEAAQPLPFAFGGEADPVNYARAMADGALLALIATLGLLQLGHETTPELVQLFASALALWSLAAAPFRRYRARLGVFVALPLLAASGAPTMALLFGLVGTIVAARSTYEQGRAYAPWIVAATLVAVLLAWWMRTWAWRVGFEPSAAQALQLGRLLLWFLWPVWLLVLLTLWRWRRHWTKRHIAAPLTMAAVALAACVAGGGFDRALMSGLPAFAVLAAFALPTLKRGTTSAIDWFSVFAFSLRRDHRLGAVRGDGDRHTGQAGGQHRQARAGFRSELLAHRIRHRRGRHAGVARARALAHRSAPLGHLEEPGAARWRCRADLAAGDDAVAAAARLRPQQPAVGGAHRAACAGGRMHRCTGLLARGGGFAGALRPLARRCARRIEPSLRGAASTGATRSDSDHAAGLASGGARAPPYRSR